MPFRILCLLIGLCYHNPINGQGGFLHLAPASFRATGNQSETVQNGNALFGNQAGLAFLENHSFLFTAENRFFLQHIYQAGLGYALPLKFGAFGFTAATFGNEYYRENKFGIAYARRLAEGTALSAQLNYNWLQVAEGGNQGNLHVDLGLQQKLTPYVYLGFQVRNPIRRPYANGYSTPTIFRLGSRLIVSKKVNLLAAIEKETNRKENVKIGFDYAIHHRLNIRFGMQTGTQSISAGAGLIIKEHITFDFAAEWNPTIGMSPSFTCLYKL